MLSINSNVRIFACTAPTDMRKSFNGLSGIVVESLGGDPLSGHLFLFTNKRRTLLKILYWDADGYAIWYKRLEEGTFAIEFVRAATEDSSSKERPSIELTTTQLAMLLGGVDLANTKKRKRFRLSSNDRAS